MMMFKKGYKLKIVALLVAITFTVSSTGYGIELSNKTHLRTHLMGNSEDGTERLREVLSKFTYHKYVNQQIAKQAKKAYKRFLQDHPEIKKNKKREFYDSLEKYPGSDIAILPIDGLYAHTGILEHIGLGRFYGKPIIYIDSSLEKEERKEVLEHAYDEVTKWTAKIKELQHQLGTKDYRVIRKHIQDNYQEFERIKDEFHEVSHNISDILRKYEAKEKSNLLDVIIMMPFEEGDIVIAAGFFSSRGSRLSDYSTGNKSLEVSKGILERLRSDIQQTEVFRERKEILAHAEEHLEIVERTISTYGHIRPRQAAEIYSIMGKIRKLAQGGGSPQAVFGVLSDGKPRTKKEIVKVLPTVTSIKTIEPDLYFLRGCELLDIGKRGRENTYTIKPELLQNLALIARIQQILDEEFTVVAEGFRNEGRIRERIRATLAQASKAGRLAEVEGDDVISAASFEATRHAVVTVEESSDARPFELTPVQQALIYYLLDVMILHVGMSSEPDPEVWHRLFSESLVGGKEIRRRPYVRTLLSDPALLQEFAETVLLLERAAEERLGKKVSLSARGYPIWGRELLVELWERIGGFKAVPHSPEGVVIAYYMDIFAGAPSMNPYEDRPDVWRLSLSSSDFADLAGRPYVQALLEDDILLQGTIELYMELHKEVLFGTDLRDYPVRDQSHIVARARMLKSAVEGMLARGNRTRDSSLSADVERTRRIAGGRTASPQASGGKMLAGGSVEAIYLEYIETRALIARLIDKPIDTVDILVSLAQQHTDSFNSSAAYMRLDQISNRQHHKIPPKAIDAAQIALESIEAPDVPKVSRGDHVVLVAGAGWGGPTVTIARRCSSDVRIVAMEHAMPVAYRAEKRRADLELKNVQVVVRDMWNPGLGQNTVDLIVLVSPAIGYMFRATLAGYGYEKKPTAYRQAIEGWLDLLKPGGRLLVGLHIIGDKITDDETFLRDTCRGKGQWNELDPGELEWLAQASESPEDNPPFNWFLFTKDPQDKAILLPWETVSPQASEGEGLPTTQRASAAGTEHPTMFDGGEPTTGGPWTVSYRDLKAKLAEIQSQHPDEEIFVHIEAYGSYNSISAAVDTISFTRIKRKWGTTAKARIEFKLGLLHITFEHSRRAGGSEIDSPHVGHVEPVVDARTVLDAGRHEDAYNLVMESLLSEGYVGEIGTAIEVIQELIGKHYPPDTDEGTRLRAALSIVIGYQDDVDQADMKAALRMAMEVIEAMGIEGAILRLNGRRVSDAGNLLLTLLGLGWLNLDFDKAHGKGRLIYDFTFTLARVEDRKVKIRAFSGTYAERKKVFIIMLIDNVLNRRGMPVIIAEDDFQKERLLEDTGIRKRVDDGKLFIIVLEEEAAWQWRNLLREFSPYDMFYDFEKMTKFGDIIDNIHLIQALARAK